MSAEPHFQLPATPPGGFTAADLDSIPDLPPHTELIDGSLIFVSPQKIFHTKAIYLFEHHLRRVAPKDLRVRREMSVILGRRQRPEPDLVVVHASAETDDDQTVYLPSAVLLAVEVVSPESEIRDRERKPQLYAQAGIKHFWRVENVSPGEMAVFVYELLPDTDVYKMTGAYRDRLTLAAPFDIDIDLTEVERL